MTDQSQPPENMIAPPGVPVIRNVNWGGLWTLYVKEVRRFFKVHLQTIWAPAITTLLFLAVFMVALGGEGRSVALNGEAIRFGDFIAPGLIVMGMLQSAFANASFSLLVGKIQGNIVDYLMPPLSTGELLGALCAGSLTRAVCVGAAVWGAMALWPGVNVTPAHLWAIFYFGLMGSLFLSLLGVLTSIWAEKFDHAALITNFVVAPLSLLSGTFYSVDRLAPMFQTISHANPFFYVISGFRYGFLGEADSNVVTGALVILLLNLGLGALCYALLRAGWKTKS